MLYTVSESLWLKLDSIAVLGVYTSSGKPLQAEDSSVLLLMVLLTGTLLQRINSENFTRQTS